MRVDRGITLLAEIDMSLVSGIKALSWIFGKQTWQASISFWPGAAGGSWNIGFGGDADILLITVMFHFFETLNPRPLRSKP